MYTRAAQTCGHRNSKLPAPACDSVSDEKIAASAAELDKLHRSVAASRDAYFDA